MLSVAVLLPAGLWLFFYVNRDSLYAEIQKGIGTYINGEVSVDKIRLTFFDDFPNPSLTLRRVSCRSHNYDQFPYELLRAERIHLHVALRPLLQKKIRVKSVEVEDAHIFLFKSQSGATNLSFFKTRPPDSVASSRLPLEVNDLRLRLVALHYLDSVRGKSMGLRIEQGRAQLLDDDSVRRFHLAGDVFFDSLCFNASRGSFVKQQRVGVDLTVHQHFLDSTIIVLPSRLSFARAEVTATGQFHQADTTFRLRFQTPAVRLEDVQTWVPNAIGRSLSRFEISNTVAADAQLRGSLRPGQQPTVLVRFGLREASVQSRNVRMNDVTSEAFFTNAWDSLRARDDRNSAIVIEQFQGKIREVPFSCRASIVDLIDPVLTLHATVDMPLTQANKQVDTTQLRFLSGRFLSDFTYQGHLNEYLDSTATRYTGLLAGYARVEDGSLLWVPKNQTLTSLRAHTSFDQTALRIDTLRLRDRDNILHLTGRMDNYVPFFVEPATKGKVTLSITSDYLNLSQWLARPKQKAKSKGAKRASRQRLSNQFDKIYNLLEFDLTLNIREFQYRKLAGRNFNTRVQLSKNELTAQPTLNFAGGRVQFSIKASHLDRARNPLFIQAKISQVDVQKLLHAFADFGQKTIQARHLRGQVYATTQFSGTINDNLDLSVPSLRGDIRMNIRNGRLIDFAPLEKLGTFLFRKRDFSDVRFAEIKTRFGLKGTEIDVARMEIESSVLQLFLEGRYSLANDTDLSIQIPLSNLKKRDKNFKPQNVGVDKKMGPSVYLRAREDEAGEMHITYDPFKKSLKGKD